MNLFLFWRNMHREQRNTFFLFFFLFLFKIFWFNYSWCLNSTFRPFSYPETYIYGLLFTLILALPVLLNCSVWVMWSFDLLLGVLLLSNLAYFYTYYTAIPLSSYALYSNMIDFTSSIYGSFSFGNILFPISTIIAAYFYLKKIKYRKDNSPEVSPKALPAMQGRIMLLGRYALLVIALVFIAGIFLFIKGGFRNAYESLQDSYTHTCGTPMYTVFGSLYYDYIIDKDVYTMETGLYIESWINEHRRGTLTAAQKNNHNALINSDINDSRYGDYTIMQLQNMSETNTDISCIIILAESLESWVLEQVVEGQEIMPNMNCLLQSNKTLYAPFVLSQVKGGRSVDAQLMINTGLLPIEKGAYSIKNPNSTFPSLAKAMKEKYDKKAYSYTLTADKPMVWNQNVILPKFGYDSLISKKDFISDEKVGPHYRVQLGDVSLLRQSVEKIKRNEVWKDGVNLLQIITYSGHFPFTIPTYLKEISFSDSVPVVMRDYMTTANYTDRALGLFVDAIKSDPKYNNTLIVIVGDHEGLVSMREDIYNSKAGRGVVSENPFVPLIITNIPESLHSKLACNDIFETTTSGCKRYNKVMGQIDIYPTLLELLGLTDYNWGGLGYSLFNQEKPCIAISPFGDVYGDINGTSSADINHLNEAWRISDKIIRYDYFQYSK